MDEKHTQTTDVKFGSKVGQIGSKWDKSGTFSDQISVQSDTLWSQTLHLRNKSTSSPYQALMRRKKFVV